MWGCGERKMVPVFIVITLLCLIECSGITHWRVHQEVIQPVNGNTIITAHQTTDSCDSSTEASCSNSETGSVNVYDKELAIIIKGLQISKQGMSVSMHVAYIIILNCINQLHGLLLGKFHRQSGKNVLQV